MDVEIVESTDFDADWPAVVELFRELNEYHLPLTGQTLLPNWQERLRTMLAVAVRSGDSLLLIAREEGEAVGFLNAHLYQDASIFRESMGFIDNVYLRPAVRGRRIASRLLAKAEAWFRKRGVTTAELNVAVANEHARRVWEAKGYEPFSERRRKPL